MIGKLTLDSPLEHCEVGVPKEVTLLVTPTANDETAGFAADVDEVNGYEEESADGKEKAYGKAMPPAVVIAIGNKPKGK